MQKLHLYRGPINVGRHTLEHSFVKQFVVLKYQVSDEKYQIDKSIVNPLVQVITGKGTTYFMMKNFWFNSIF